MTASDRVARHSGDLVKRYRSFVLWYGVRRGSVRFTHLLWSKLLERGIGFEAMYLFERATALRAAPPADFSDTAFEAAGEKDYADIGGLTVWRSSSYIHERLRNGETCYVARMPSGGIAAWIWAAPGERAVFYRSAAISIGTHETYVHDVRTLPAYRGRGITPRFLAWLTHQLAEQGSTKIVAAIMAVNYSSQRSFAAAGFRRRQTLYFVKLPFAGREIFWSGRQADIVRHGVA